MSWVMSENYSDKEGSGPKEFLNKTEIVYTGTCYLGNARMYLGVDGFFSHNAETLEGPKDSPEVAL